jgi:hypothetical protein
MGDDGGWMVVVVVINFFLAKWAMTDRPLLLLPPSSPSSFFTTKFTHFGILALVVGGIFHSTLTFLVWVQHQWFQLKMERLGAEWRRTPGGGKDGGLRRKGS